MPYLFDFNKITNLDTEIMEIFHKSTEILEKFPKIRNCADFDLERYALKKKDLCLSVKKYNKEQTNGKDSLSINSVLAYYNYKIPGINTIRDLHIKNLGEYYWKPF